MLWRQPRELFSRTTTMSMLTAIFHHSPIYLCPFEPNVQVQVVLLYKRAREKPAGSHTQLAWSVWFYSAFEDLLSSQRSEGRLGDTFAPGQARGGERRSPPRLLFVWKRALRRVAAADSSRGERPSGCTRGVRAAPAGAASTAGPSLGGRVRPPHPTPSPAVWAAASREARGLGRSSRPREEPGGAAFPRGRRCRRAEHRPARPRPGRPRTAAGSRLPPRVSPSLPASPPATTPPAAFSREVVGRLPSALSHAASPRPQVPDVCGCLRDRWCFGGPRGHEGQFSGERSPRVCVVIALFFRGSARGRRSCPLRAASPRSALAAGLPSGTGRPEPPRPSRTPQAGPRPAGAAASGCLVQGPRGRRARGVPAPRPSPRTPQKCPPFGVIRLPGKGK